MPPVSQLLAIQSSTVTSRGSNASGAVMGSGNTQRVASRSFTNTFVAEAVVNNANNRVDQYHQQDQKLIQEVAELVLEVVSRPRGNHAVLKS